jgi:HK97 family phage portal protein
MFDKIVDLASSFVLTKTERALEPLPSSAAGSAMLGKSAPPKRGSTELVLAYRSNPWLRSVVSKISTSVSTVQWKLYRSTSSQKSVARGVAKSISRAVNGERAKSIARALQDGSLTPIDDHALLDFLYAGNRHLSGQACLQVTQSHLDLLGESFWMIERFADGKPAEYWPMPPHWVSKMATIENPFFEIRTKNGMLQIPADDIIYFKHPDPADPYGRGTGIGESLSDELDTDEYASKYLKSFFYNSALPDALISFKGVSEEQLLNAKARWENKYRGSWNSHRAHFHNGDVDVKVLSQSFKDQELTKLREAARDTTIHTFGVPPEILGLLENSNRATIDSAEAIMAKFVVSPRLDFLCSFLQTKVVERYDETLVLGFVSPIPEDREYELKVAQAAPWSRSRAEWREMQGLASNGASDEVYLVPIGLVQQEVGSSELPAAPQPVASTAPAKHLSTQHKAVSEKEIESVVDSLRPERLSDPAKKLWPKEMKKWGTQVLNDLGSDVGFNLLNPKMVDHMAEFLGDRITDINETTKDKLRETLIEGVRDGEGYKDLAGRVEDVFGEISDWRAETIARTETLRSANFGTYEAQTMSGLVQIRQWVATRDDRVRDEHLALDGKQSAIDEPFEVGSYSAMMPCDFGEPGMDINCRCTTVAVIGEAKDTQALDAVWKKFEDDVQSWEKKSIAMFKAAFSTQQRDALKQLAKVAK